MEKSLFISSFDRVLYHVYGLARNHLGLGSYYVWHYVLLFFVFSLLVLLWCRFRPRLHPGLRHFTMAMIAVSLIRIMLFDNPLAWRSYMSVITEESLSYLRAKLAAERIKKLELFPAKCNYLIAGSSLTYAALEAFKNLDSSTEYIFIYGMRPMELAFCEKEIESFNPSRLILYLTIYDLGNVAWQEKYESFYAFHNEMLLLLNDKESSPYSYRDLKLYLMRGLAGRLFLEYRFSLIFREYLNKFLNRPTLPTTSGKSKEEILSFKLDHQKAVFATMSQKKVELNIRFLEKFFDFCRRKRVNVIVLEGQINPTAVTPERMELSRIAIKKLKQSVDKYDHVRFVPIAELRQLGPEDFKDMIHVKEESSVKYSQSVMAYLQKMPPFPDR